MDQDLQDALINELFDLGEVDATATDAHTDLSGGWGSTMCATRNLCTPISRGGAY